MEDNTSTNPKSRDLALNSLQNHPGWAIYCQRFTEILKLEIDGKIFDVKTPPEERENLIRARAVLNERYTPDKIVATMRVVARNEIDRVERDKK